MHRYKTSCFSLILLVSVSLSAQDAHYWNSQYSPGGYFLPGAVIANNGDSGVLFFNPALLPYSRLTLLSASATVYNFEQFRIMDGAGKGRHLKSSSSGSVPLLAAGNFRLPGRNKKIIIAYGLFQPRSFAFAASQRRDERFNVLNDRYSPGPEFFVGQLLQENHASEFHGVVSAGFRLFGNVTAGITLEGIRRKQTHSLEYYGRALINPGITDKVLSGYDISYYATYVNYSLAPKIGFAWEKGRSHIGLVVSLPSLRVGGSGTLLVDNVINNLDFANVGVFESLLANTRQEKLRSTWKRPLSVAAGYTQDFKQWQLYMAAEYFAKIKEYDVLRPRSEFFIRPDTGQNNFVTPDLLRLRDARKAVVNFSVGSSYQLNAKFRLYLSLRTDFSYVDKEAYEESVGFTHNTTDWNIYHLQTGVNIRKQKYNLRAGMYTSVGRNNSHEPQINLDNPNEGNFLLGDPVPSQARYFSMGLMLSYVHNF